MPKDNKTRMLVEIAIMTAFAFMLSFIRVGRMPQGGSISLQMLPIFVLAMRWGPKGGILGGVLLSLLKLMTPEIYHPAQFLLDYPLAFGAIGLAGFFRRTPSLGIIVGGLGRFIFTFLSGAIFFGHYAPEGMNVLVYSFVYNITYMGPEVLLSLLIAPQVFRRLDISTDAAASWRVLATASFISPLMGMGVMFRLQGWPIVNQIFIGVSVVLLVVNLILWQHRDPKKKSAGRNGLFLMIIPPIIVYVASLIIGVLS